MSVVVYTAILGASDTLKPAPRGADRCVCFTDDSDQDAQGWQLIKWGATDSPRREAWRLRCVPHQLFNDYDTVIWVDASFSVTDLGRLLADANGFQLSGLKHAKRRTCYEEGREIINLGQAPASAVGIQLDEYRKIGFKPDALTISCVLVRAHTPAVQAFNESWDVEIHRHPGDNTQISLDYCAWKAGLTVHHLQGVRKDNPYAVHDHEDHKRRRRPYQ